MVCAVLKRAMQEFNDIRHAAEKVKKEAGKEIKKEEKKHKEEEKKHMKEEEKKQKEEEKKAKKERKRKEKEEEEKRKEEEKEKDKKKLPPASPRGPAGSKPPTGEAWIFEKKNYEGKVRVCLRGLSHDSPAFFSHQRGRCGR